MHLAGCRCRGVRSCRDSAGGQALVREWRAAEEAKRKRREEVERHRRDTLNDAVRRWRRAQDIRAYCQALTAARSGDDVDANTQWTLKSADSIDPLVP